jgi:subtilase family serine protease
MIKMRSLPLWTLVSAVFSCVAVAQSAAPAVRIVSPIDESQLVTLKGNVNPRAIAQNDRGPVSADLPMAGLTLVLSRSADQQSAFDAFVASQYDQSSPNFHQWLTPQQVGERFGPAQADISTISGWLSSHGFAVKSIGADRMTIRFSGTAGQVESTFHTQIHNLSVKGQAHIANMTDPQIPAALAPVVFGIKGLHNFLPHPEHKVGSRVHFNADANGWVKLQPAPGTGSTTGMANWRRPATSANSASSSKPNFFINNYNLGVEEDVAPYDFAKIYNLPSGWPSSTNGTNQTITIIGTSDICIPAASSSPGYSVCGGDNDVAEFKTAFGLPAGLAPKIVHGPDGDPGNCGNNSSADACTSEDVTENSLDVEWSGAVAPGAQIVLVTDAYNSQTDPTNDPIYDGAQWAIENASGPVQADGSSIISVSYGTCELFNGTASNVAYNNLWEEAYTTGVAVFVATGDSGSAACDDGGDSDGNPYEAQFGLSVSGTASTPYNTAVGGTDFSWCQPTIIQSGSNEGGVQGCSSTNASTYWNATTNGSQQQTANGYVPETPWNDTCENPINAAFLNSTAAYFNVQGLGVGTYTTPEESCNFIYNSSLSGELYGLYESDEWPEIWTYVDTVGGSGGPSNCVSNNTDSIPSSSSEIPTCSAGATSTGSSNGNLTLVNNGWPKPSWQSGVTGIPSDGVRDLPDVSFFAGDGTLDSATLICDTVDGASCTQISETGMTNSSGTPYTTGAEELGGTSVATPEMAGVMALINQSTGASQGSPNAELYKLASQQTYSECSAEGPTSSNCYFQGIDQGTNTQPCAVSTNDVEGLLIFDPDPAVDQWVENPDAYNADQASPNCTVINAGDAIGTLSGYSAAAGYNLATGLGSLNIANVIANWTAATPPPPTGTATATVGITPAATSINSNQTLGVAVTVSGSSGTPTGTVTLTISGTTYSATGTLDSTGSYTFTIPVNTFTASGSTTLTVKYSGDATYAPASNTASVTVTYIAPPTYGINAISNPTAISSPGGSTTASVTVASTGGYAGTVTLSCALTSSPSGATDLPTCSGNPTVTLSSSTTSGSASFTVATTSASGALSYPKLGNGKGWLGAGSGAVLALLVFFGIPGRRKSWRAMLGMVVLLMTLGSMAACGGGSTTITVGNTGTTTGNYTFTVTSSSNPSTTASPASQTFTVTVN